MSEKSEGAIRVASPNVHDATFVAWDGNELSMHAPRAYPPGARLEGTLDAHALRMKVHRCRRVEEGRFLVIGRPLDLRREAADHLATLARTSPESAVVPRW